MLGGAVVLFVFMLAAPASAHEAYQFEVPNTATAMSAIGEVKPCITCHDNPDGGAGCRVTGGMSPCLNPFGLAFMANGRRWDPSLASLDSDGDGFTNGQELQDPAGTWVSGEAATGIADYVTRPGFPDSAPGTRDDDGDGYCWFGRDLDDNGDCRGAGENDGSLDCDDSDPAVNSGATELCTNTVDNDCNGLPTLLDPVCESVVDRDGDGFCPMGRDLSRDGDCLDADEMTDAVDCDDERITVFPGARENCDDGLDNDCSGESDSFDPMCRGDADADGDGYCPVGRDLNGDGDCLDLGEAAGGFDCDDSDPLANPDQPEICTDAIDNDCDGRPNFDDTECASLFDADDDGYCPVGRDLNGDRDCADDGEEDEGGDCDDMDATRNPGVRENCTNTTDDDCDDDVSLGDDDCAGYLDTDGDRYCFVGFDFNRDGDCADDGEEAGLTDCDDGVRAINPTATEVCTDGVDNDCDGSTDAFDPVCSEDYLDHDGDSWCGVGEDLNRDGDCSDAGEQAGPADSAPRDSTISPGSDENCFDMKDNDQDGTVDMADSDCTRDTDADMDGYCAIGRDVNGDGDCLDDDENYAESDCAESNPDIHPGAVEDCFDRLDNDCDGDVDLLDEDCWRLLDRDGDGFCGTGIDDTSDGDCLDTDEDRFGMDCDDTDPAISPRAAEICDDMVDNDCDGMVDGADSACGCVNDLACDDGDECTIDTCGDDGACTNTPDPACMMSDAGPTADTGTPPDDDDGCGCAASRGAPTNLILIALAMLFVRRKRS